MEQFFGFINSPNLLGIFIKLFGIILGLIYILFCFIMIKQIGTMKETINIKDQGLLRTAALLQLGFAIVIVLYALIVL